MARGSLVAVSYPADDEFAQINTGVLRGLAEVVFLDSRSDEEFRKTLRQADVLIGWHLSEELPAAVWQDSPRLRLVQLLSAGADSVDFAAIPERVMVAANAGAYSEPMAEYVMAVALALARRLPQRHADLARGEFKMWERVLTLDGAVCAILGFGGIGQATARLMRAFGARIYGVNSSGRTDEPVEFIGTLADLDQVLAVADVLVVALPLINATRSLIGARELRLMKAAAILVNVGRAAIVDERALYEHLRDQPEFCAGIDAWWHEPGPGSRFSTSYPFFDLPNLIGSPHNSGVTDGALQVGARKAAENVRRFLTGEAVTGVTRREDYLRP
ncbi:MAG TPA: 2-hydroxyacid dehydrogenase [Streptosporangiaceae bacterium]|nr:2-hydroxyacid dehydrogenase [Streptosporangiaceae bacterium]